MSNEPGNRYNIQLINALVLYVGTQAIAHIHNKGSTPSMSTITHSAHMDIFQNLAVDLDTEGELAIPNVVFSLPSDSLRCDSLCPLGSSVRWNGNFRRTISAFVSVSRAPEKSPIARGKVVTFDTSCVRKIKTSLRIAGKLLDLARIVTKLLYFSDYKPLILTHALNHAAYTEVRL